MLKLLNWFFNRFERRFGLHMGRDLNAGGPTRRCPVCGGDGLLDVGDVCPECNGSGKVA